MILNQLFNEGTNWHTDPEQQSMDATRRARLGREREPEGSDAIDARLAANNNARQEYAETGRFWLKRKDSQEHISDAFVGKVAATAAAQELLKQQPELRGNLVITAYGPGEQQPVSEGKVKELGQDLKDKALSDAEFKAKYGKTRAEVRAAMREKPVAEGSYDYVKRGKELDAATKRVQSNLDRRIRGKELDAATKSQIRGKELDAATKRVQSNLDRRIKKLDQGVEEAYQFKGPFPFDVDHMHGGRGINLPKAETKKYFTDKKQWQRAVDDINSSKYDDNSDYIGVTGRSTVEINGREWARWSDAQQKGYIELSSMSEQGVAEGVRDLGYDAQSLIMKLRRDVEEKRLQPTPQAVLAAARELAGDMEFAPQLLVKQVLGQGVAEGSSTTWEVSFDYGPHQSETVNVKAGSEEEARAKVETAAEKRGRSIMINWAKPAEQDVAEGWKGELAGGTIGGIAGNLAGSALGGPIGGIVGGAVGGAGGGIIGRELTKEEQLNEFAPVLAAGARLVIAMAPKIAQVLKNTGKATAKAVAPVAKSGAEIAAKNAGQIGVGLGAYEIGSSVADIAKDITAKVGTALEEKTVMELAQVAFKFAIPAGIVLAILYGGKKVIDSLFSDSKTEQGVAEGNYDRDDYYNARQGREYGRDLTATGYGGDGSGTRRDDIFKGQSKNLPADPFRRTSGAVPYATKGQQHRIALPGEVDEGEKVGNMDADKFDAAMARLKQLAGAGPMKTVYDPAKRVYRNMPTAQQPGNKK